MNRAEASRSFRDFSRPPLSPLQSLRPLRHHRIHTPSLLPKTDFTIWYRHASLCLASQPLNASKQRLLVAVIPPQIAPLRNHSSG